MTATLRTCVTAVAAALTGATLATAPAQARMDKLGKGEGFVDIVAWPGYIERGETDKSYDWVTDFEKKTGCKVRVKTANTSDEMVALMNEGGFDLVTASGDASLRLIAGGRVQEVNTSLIPELQERRPASAEGALALRERQELRRALPVGLQRAGLQHERLQDTAHQLGGRVQGDHAAGRQVEQGTGAGLRWPDLHRRCGPVPDEDQTGSGDQEPLRAERGSVQGCAATCCASSASWCPAIGTTR